MYLLHEWRFRVYDAALMQHAMDLRYNEIGEHFGPVRSEVAALATRKTLFFSRVTSLTASATPEFGTSVIISTPSISNHFRANWRSR